MTNLDFILIGAVTGMLTLAAACAPDHLSDLLTLPNAGILLLAASWVALIRRQHGRHGSRVLDTHSLHH